MGMNEFTMEDALRHIGRKDVEITVLQQRLRLLEQHACAPCERDHVKEEKPDASDVRSGGGKRTPSSRGG